MGEGLKKAIRQVEALKFLNDVGENGGILKFRKKISEGEFLRTALISHLKSLFIFSAEEADEVITKFLGRG